MKNALNAQMELAHLTTTQQKHQLTQLLMQQQHAQLEAQEAQSQSDKTQLKAFSGVITDVMAAEGEQARPGQTLLTLTDPKQNILTVHLPYTYITRLLLKNATAVDESGTHLP